MVSPTVHRTFFLVVLLVKQGILLVNSQRCSYDEIDPGCNVNSKDECLNPEVAGANAFVAEPCSNQYLVSLQELTDQDECYFHFCGGTFIASNLILTAAHCIYRPEDPIYSGTSLSQVYVAHVPRCRHLGGLGRYSVTSFWIFEAYDDNSIANDIAILQINETVEASIAKYQVDEVLGDFRVEDLHVIGWGSTNRKEEITSVYNVVPLKQASDMKLVSAELCEQKLSEVGENDPVMTGMICAEGVAADTCSGDSGGPLLYYTQDGQVYVIGIVSWGARTSQCTTSRNVTQPGVYTAVAVYQNWIQDKVDKYGQFLTAAPTPTTRNNIAEEDCSVTIGGCKCITECAKKGFPRYWCEVDEKDDCFPFQDRQLFYDYCDKGCGIDTSSNSQESDCSISLGGCQCEDDCSMGFDGRAYCNVEQSCDEALIDNELKIVYDFCGKRCLVQDCSVTLSGCKCDEYCSSTNNDPNGNWCYINKASCDTDSLLEWQREGNQYWDYCVQGCRGFSRGEQCNDGCICEPRLDKRGSILQDFCWYPEEISPYTFLPYEVDTTQPYCKVVNPSECGKTYINCNYSC